VLVKAEANKAIIRRLIGEVYYRGNLDVVDELVAPDVFNQPTVPEHQHGIDGFKHVIVWVREFSSDVHYAIDDIIAEGDRVAVRMTNSGTHTGTVRGTPLPANVSRSTTSIGSFLRTERSRSYGP
jgi:predicted ester cyclase